MSILWTLYLHGNGKDNEFKGDPPMTLKGHDITLVIGGHYVSVLLLKNARMLEWLDSEFMLSPKTNI